MKEKSKLVVVLGIAVLAGAGYAAEVPSEFQTGMTWGFSERAGYFETAEARAEVDRMKEAGIGWVVLTPNVWQEGWSSTRQFVDFERSIPDFELMDIIDYIHSKGMKVQLRPMLECVDGSGRLDVVLGPDWPRVGKERNFGRNWFASMRARSRWYARLAERTKCEMYCLDSELDRFCDRNEDWKSVVKAVREVYHGPVTSCHTIHAPPRSPDFLKLLGNRDCWWYDLDLLSISDYWPARDPSDRDPPSVERMMKVLEPHRELLRRIAAKFGKPVIFGECGCGSRRFQAASPSGCDLKQPVDGEEQAAYMEAFFRTFKDEKWCRGFYWWRWSNRNHSTGRMDGAGEGFSPQGLPSIDVMRRIYGER